MFASLKEPHPLTPLRKQRGARQRRAELEYVHLLAQRICKPATEWKGN
jgi:hypothetical protein